MTAIKKGDRVVYTGNYAESVPDHAKYPPGTVVGFRNSGTFVTVKLDGDGERFADWPIRETERLQ